MRLLRLLPVVSLGLVINLLAPARGSAASKPNILFLLVDDLRHDTFGFAGHEICQTPHLDQLAARGMKFTDFHSSGAVCSPTLSV